MTPEGEAALIKQYLDIVNECSQKEFQLKGENLLELDKTNILLGFIETKLSAVKSRTGAFPCRRRWRAHTEWTHVLGRPTLASFGIQSSRAYLKFCDLLHRFPELMQQKSKGSKLRSLHLCEAPGNFVAALGDSFGETKASNWEWVINSLNPHHEWNDPSNMLIDDALLLTAAMKQQTFYGSRDTGNVFDLTHADLETIGKFDLVTADGSFDCTANPERQEELVEPLIAREVFLACSALVIGGNFVLKLFTFFKEETQNILYGLIGSFDTVFLRKPTPSKPGNSEVYAVCLGFKGCVTIDTAGATKQRVTAASIFFAELQIKSIEINLNAVETSQYFKCQIDDFKVSCATHFFQNIPKSFFWATNAVPNSLFPCKQSRIDLLSISLSFDPFVNDNHFLCQTIISIPKINQNVLPPVINALFNRNSKKRIVDFCELATSETMTKIPQIDTNNVHVIDAWKVSKLILLQSLLQIVYRAEKIIINSVEGQCCGILSRFAVSIMAVLLHYFQLDDIPLPQKSICLTRKRPVDEKIIHFIEQIIQCQANSEVLCFIPMGDTSEAVRSFLRYYNK